MNLRTAIRNAVRDAIHDAGIANFPPKDFYFTDFTGIANNTKLRDLPGWQSVSSTSNADTARDKWVVSGGKILRVTGSEDYWGSPGKFIIGRTMLTTDHTIRVKLTTAPTNGNTVNIVVGAVDELNCLGFRFTNSNGSLVSLQFFKTVGGTVTMLATPAYTSLLGRGLMVGDTIEVSLIGRHIHVFVNTFRMWDGINIDTGGAFTKGNICGVGTSQAVGTSFDDLYTAELSASLTVAATQKFWPGATWLGGRAVPLSGTYAGDVQALDYRVVEEATSGVVQGWARVASPIIASGNWSANVFVPMCNATTHPRIRVELRVANDTDARASTTATCVGICIGSYGQSNSANRGAGVVTSYATSGSYSFGADNGSVWIGGGLTATARSQKLAQQISTASNIPCGVFVGGTGAASIYALRRRDGDGQLDELESLASFANAYGYIAAWLWTQGEAEASAFQSFNETAYRSDFDLLLLELRAGLSGGKPVSVGVCVIGRTTGGHGFSEAFGNANWSAARAGLYRLGDKPGVYIANNLNDAPMADALHYTSDAYVENGRRAGMSIKKAMGYGGHDGRGPVITSAARSGAVITLPMDLNGATSVVGTGLTNYEVSANDFASVLAINSVAVSGSNIVITLSADPGAAVKVRSFYGMTYGTPTLAIGTYADGTTIPVEPLFAPITAA